MRQLRWSNVRRYPRSPLFWLAILYLVVGIVYAWVTPMLEKPDEEGHYGYIRYLREHHELPPLYSSDPWLAESKQPPLYYVFTAALTSWLPDIADTGELLVLNPYMDFSVPGYRDDNRNQYLHPPDLTPVVVASRLVSLAFGLGTMLVSYWLASQLCQHPAVERSGLFPKSSLVPLAVAAVVAFQPNFLYIATAVDNDATFAIYEAASGAVAPAHPPAAPIQVGDLAFLGHTTLNPSAGQAGQAIEVWTFWRVEALPERPLSLMLHLMGPGGSPVVVGDGLGVPVENWQVGDVIIQRHLLEMPPESPAGDYALYTGAYWLDSLERWPVLQGGQAVGDRLALTPIQVTVP